MYSKEKAKNKIELHRNEISTLCQYIFENPELGFNEYKASEALSDFLSKHGFEVQRNIGGLETAFRAEKKGTRPGPKIAFLCEYDALPNGHSCGHHIIGTSAVAAAIGLAGALEDFEGSVVVLGTPAEEGAGGGKEILYQAGVMDDIDCAMIFHPGPETVLNDILLAISSYSFVFHGKAAHAGAAPEKGASALEAVIQMFNNINGIRANLPENSRVFGIIKQGGVATNIIPDLTEAEFGIRALTKELLDDLVNRVKECAQAAALSTRCSVEIKEIGVGYMNLINNKTLLSLAEKNLVEMGEKIDVYNATRGLGSSDVGNISQRIPAFQIMFGIGEPAILHTDSFAQACSGEKGVDIAIRAAKILAMTGVDLFNEPDLVKQAKEELKQTKDIK